MLLWIFLTALFKNYLFLLDFSRLMRVPCVKCKGDNPRLYCGRDFCPIYVKSQAMFKVKPFLERKDFSGSSPTPFVGRFGYPNISVGLLSLPNLNDDAWLYDAPAYWADNNYSIPDLVGMRSSLINSRFSSNVCEARRASRMLGLSQEVGMASKPVDIDVSLEAVPKFRWRLDPFLAPMGPNARLEGLKLASNPKVPVHVDKVVSDTDLRASDALSYLRRHGYDETYMTRMLSVGTLGIGKDRRLVPTRWSITAVDDTLAKQIHRRVIDLPCADFQSYFGGYLGNYFLILFFPDVWSYELFETYLPNASWNLSSDFQYTTDYEPFSGRKTYAENCGGGYYASRLPVLEKLDSIGRQASVLALRFITGEYSVPLGVWVVREAVRKALSEKPIVFSDRDLMFKYALSLVRKKFGYNLQCILRKSVVMKRMMTQAKLTDFA